jgi:hypothetical protein
MQQLVVVTNQDNGAKNATLGKVANLVSVCAVTWPALFHRPTAD